MKTGIFPYLCNVLLMGTALAFGAEPPPVVNTVPTYLITAAPTGAVAPGPSIEQAKGWDLLILGSAKELGKPVGILSSSHQDNGKFDTIQIVYPGFKTTHTLFVWSLKADLPKEISSSKQAIREFASALLGFDISFDKELKIENQGTVYSVIPKSGAPTEPWVKQMKAIVEGNQLFIYTLKAESGISSSRPSIMPEMNKIWFGK